VRILYVAMKYDYGKPERGLSFEHWNFYDSLARMGHDLLYFDFMTLYQERGRESMNRRLLDVARAERADMLFCVLFTDELDPEVMRRIGTETSMVTVNWFCDDHWRFENFSNRWAPNFEYVVTTASSAVPKYEAIGYQNVIKSQWACNHRLYRKLDLPPRYDVTFIGQPHGNRRAIIDAVRRAGIDVHTWGTGWDAERLDQDAMIRVMNESRITLNLSNASKPRRDIRSLARIGITYGRSLASRRGGTHPAASVAASARFTDQIKARNFEAPGCGTFLLTGRADDLERYYDLENEVAVFDGVDDLVEKIRHYLVHDDDRQRLADAGHARTLREHTYDHRFAEIFERTGLDRIAAPAPGSGVTQEVGYPRAPTVQR
jgi:spore maturation protein CgeB